MQADGVEKYIDALEQRKTFYNILEDYSEELRPVIEEGIARASTVIAEIESDQDFILNLAEVGRVTLQDLVAIDENSRL